MTTSLPIFAAGRLENHEKLRNDFSAPTILELATPIVDEAVVGHCRDIARLGGQSFLVNHSFEGIAASAASSTMTLFAASAIEIYARQEMM